ncbi:MAG: IS481 family transposase [Mycobacterium sp.]|nr:IS481 family transposase [Mycobacterium sp.]
MAQKVTAMDIRFATAYVGEIVNVSQFCRDHQISRQTFYKWRRQFLADGIDGLHERSRRPKSCPGKTPAAVEELVVRTRKNLLEQGLDHGPQSIVWALQRRGKPAPSRSTVSRILTRRGLITPQPRKRPKSATKRFCYTRPNDCWQSDWTGWQLADRAPVAIAGTLDDHSRYAVGLRAGPGDGTAALVWSVMLAGIAECGIPAMSLADNGYVYTGRLRGFEVDFEANLRALGTRTINSTPRHPQTCGKIERFWQTLKKWLRAQPVPTNLAELNILLDRFRQYYNHHRPHRALKGATPAEAFAATTPARPADRPLPGPVFVGYHQVVEDSGVIFIAPYRVNVGRRWGGHWCHSIRDGDHIVIISGTTLVRDFNADPGRYYQRGDKTTRTYRNREPQAAS